MQDIVDKYKSDGSPYLLPLIDHNVGDERPQYLSMSHKINRHLKRIGQQVGISIPLTMYVARHAWASIARSRNIPLSIISEGMGHDSESTTRIYLASLDNSAIDNANSIILGLL
jgi:integrase